MDTSILKPVHGWRAFAGEVGVVVLGVLLALIAQQIAQNFQNKADARALRETIDHEIGLNLFVYDVRARQFDCDAKRVAELKSWLASSRSGAKTPAIIARSPATLTPYRSAWDTRDAQVFNHLPREVRQKYAEFYDELSNNWSMTEAESESWRKLEPYAEPGPISLSDRRTIRPIVGQIRAANETLRLNIPLSGKIADVLKIRPVSPDNIPADWLKHVADCPSVIASGG
jgi:hypothetical protein